MNIIRMTTVKDLLLVSTVLLSAVLAGCSGGDEAPAEEASAERSAVGVPRQAPRSTRGSDVPHVSELDADKPLLEAPRLRGGGESESSDGLDLVLFASDRTEYRDSLRLIAENSSDEQFQQLDAALKWLLINDTSIMNDEQRLFETINGMTGTEVLALVAQRLADRGR